MDGVGVLSLCPGPVPFVRPLDPADADPKPPGGPRRIEAALAVGDGALALPQAQHLADLLFERHAREQVVDPAFDGEGRIQVGRALGGRRIDREHEGHQPASQRAHPRARDGHRAANAACTA